MKTFMAVDQYGTTYHDLGPHPSEGAVGPARISQGPDKMCSGYHVRTAALRIRNRKRSCGWTWRESGCCMRYAGIPEMMECRRTMMDRCENCARLEDELRLTRDALALCQSALTACQERSNRLRSQVIKLQRISGLADRYDIHDFAERANATAMTV